MKGINKWELLNVMTGQARILVSPSKVEYIACSGYEKGPPSHAQ